MNLAAVIAGAVNGAVQSVIPPVAADVVQTIAMAQDASPSAPAVAPPPALDADTIAGKVLDRVLADPALAKITTPIPWYQSQAIWGGIIAGVSALAGLTGYSLLPDDQTALAVSLAQIGGGVGSIMAIRGRLTTTRQIKGA